MTDGPDLALQDAMVATLKANAAVAAIVGARIYDRVPDKAPLPLVDIGEIQVIADDADCLEGSSEVYATLHAWSRSVGAVECRRLAAAVVAALHLAALDLGVDWRLVDIRHHDTRVFTDADGLTSHGVVTFRALIDPVS